MLQAVDGMPYNNTGISFFMTTLPRPLLLLLAISLPVQAENLTPNLKFNGFATATVSAVNDDQGGEYIPDLYGYPGISETANAGLESLIGLQFDYRVNEQVNVVAQLVAQGRNNYEVNAEWAYIGYQINDQLRLRAGRFGLPTFMFSDTIHVGQSYPWARLPVEVYNGVPVTNFDGVDLLYRQPLGDWSLDAQVLLGGSNTDLFRTQNAVGANVSLSNGNLTARIGVVGSELTLDTASLISVCTSTTAPFPGTQPAFDAFCGVNEKKTTFSNAGLLYDDGQWFFAGEFAQLKIDGWLNDWNSGYLSVGHYVGKWLPYLLWSKINAFAGDECTAIAPYCSFNQNYDEQTTLALGAKYAISGNVSLKGQVDRVSNFNGTHGLLDGVGSTPDAFNVFTLSLTAAF